MIFLFMSKEDIKLIENYNDKMMFYNFFVKKIIVGLWFNSMNMFKFLSTDGTSVYCIDIQQYSSNMGQIMHNNKKGCESVMACDYKRVRVKG